MTESDTPQKSSRKHVFIIIGFFVLAVFLLCGTYVYWQLNKITYTAMDKSNEALGINPEVQETSIIREYPPLNIALLGIDQENLDDPGRADVIMILSIDKRNHAIKLSSIMRDTYVNIPGHGMDKINHAFVFGGPPLIIQTINSNFDMDIRDYAFVSFDSMAKIVDYLGGIDINVMEEEVSRVEGLTEAGRQHLNGQQAVDYARIRYVGNGDYERTERQRSVLTEVIYKVQALDHNEVPGLVSELLPYIVTSFSKTDLIKMGVDALTSNLTSVQRTRIPLDSACEGKTINGVYYLVPDLPANTAALHDFIDNR